MTIFSEKEIAQIKNKLKKLDRKNTSKKTSKKNSEPKN